MKFRLLTASGTATAILLFFAGCANHLEDITKEIPENTRQVVSRQYILTTAKNTPDSSTFKVTLEQIENIRVTTYQVRKVSTICTPYEGWRESYEFWPASGCSRSPCSPMCSVSSRSGYSRSRGPVN